MSIRKKITKINLIQFFRNWNGYLLTVPALALFILFKIGISIATNGYEQGYVWSQLHVIFFGWLKFFSAEAIASLALYVNQPNSFKAVFRTTDTLREWTESRKFGSLWYCSYLLAAAILMAFV